MTPEELLAAIRKALEEGRTMVAALEVAVALLRKETQ